MHNFFPRINLLAEIYKPDKKIAELVVDVHYNMVFFARDAAFYFVKKSRMLQSLDSVLELALIQKVVSWRR